VLHQPYSPNDGDIICALLGSNLHVFLRPEGVDFRFVGTCRLSGALNAARNDLDDEFSFRHREEMAAWSIV
jgi:hypothetical protein